MKPSARIQAVIDYFKRSCRQPRPHGFDDWRLHARAPLYRVKDRAAIVDRVYDCMRHHARVGWCLEKSEAPDTPRNRVLTHLVIVDARMKKRIRDLFDGSIYSPEELNEDELNLDS